MKGVSHENTKPPTIAQLTRAWKEMGGLAERIGPAVQKIREIMKASDAEALAVFFATDPLMKKREKERHYAAYVGLLDFFYSDPVRKEAFLGAIETFGRTTLRTGEHGPGSAAFDHLIDDVPVFVPGNIPATIRAVRLMRDQYGEARGDVFSGLLHAFDTSIKHGLIQLDPGGDPYLHFRDMVKNGFGTMRKIALAITAKLDEPGSEARLRDAYDIPTQDVATLTEKKREIAFTSLRHSQSIALSHMRIMTSLVTDAEYVLEQRGDDFVVTTKSLTRFEHEIRSGIATATKQKGSITSKVLQIPRRGPAVGCPAAFSPLFLDVARRLIDGHYSRGVHAMTASTIEN